MPGDRTARHQAAPDAPAGIRLVAFDLDGTLTLAQCVAYFARRLGTNLYLRRCRPSRRLHANLAPAPSAHRRNRTHHPRTRLTM